MGSSCSACSYCQKNTENQLEIHIDVKIGFLSNKSIDILKEGSQPSELRNPKIKSLQRDLAENNQNKEDMNQLSQEDNKYFSSDKDNNIPESNFRIKKLTNINN